MFHSARQIAASMILAMTMSAMDKVIAEQVAGDSAATKVRSENNEHNSAVQMTPINIIGVTPNQPSQPNTITLKGRSLRLQQGNTLGQTLNEELGVSNASFGPGVGIPVIRGLTGSRVRILQNGIGTHDATSLSPDHAVAIDPLFAEEIRIMRGPEIVRYGGNAIGGIVDVNDHRIPGKRTTKPISGSVESRYDTNGDGTNSAFKLNLGKDRLAFNLGGFFRKRGNTQIPEIGRAHV